MPPSLGGHRLGVHTGKRRVHTPVNSGNAAHMQARRVHTIDATGGQQIAFLHVCAGRYKFQIQRAAQGLRVTMGHITAAGSGVHDRNALRPVGQQRDLADQRINARDLPHHTSRVNDRRAWRNARHQATVHHHALGIGIRRVIKHLHGLGRTRHLGPQVKQLPQQGVLLAELLHLLQTLGLGNGAGLKVQSRILRVFQIAKVTRQGAERIHGLQRQPLQGGQNQGHTRADGLRNLHPMVGGHQQHCQQPQQQRLGSRRQALPKDRRCTAFKRIQGHGSIAPDGGEMRK